MSSVYYNPNSGKKFYVEDLEMPDWFGKYCSYLSAVRNLTTNTIITYYTPLREFLCWAYLRGTPHLDREKLDQVHFPSLPVSIATEISQEDIEEYLAFCANTLENGPETRARKLSAIRSLYNYLVEREKTCSSNPAERIPRPKKEKALPKYLSEGECLQMLKAAAENPVSDFQERDFCMLTFFLNCGMRISELVAIDLNHIHGEVLRLHGKGRKERELYLNAACMAALERYLHERQTVKHSAENPALFISKRTGERITARRVHQIVEAQLVKAGLDGKGYSPHKLRHTAATLMYNSGGVDLLTLATVLGHESVATSQIYTHLSNDSVKEALKSNPLANVGITREEK